MMPHDTEGDEISQGSSAQGGNGAPTGDGIPDAPEGNPTFDASVADDGTQRPLAPLPPADFWEVLYGRRSRSLLLSICLQDPYSLRVVWEKKKKVFQQDVPGKGISATLQLLSQSGR